MFRSYVSPYMDRPNLTVLTGALVTRLAVDRNRATGVEFSYDGTTHRVRAGSEVVFSLGAIHTPKVLMQSGIGDQAELQRLGIPVVQHLPGVGRNLQDHPDFAVSGSISSRCRRATPRLRRPISGRAPPIWTPRICRPGKLKFPSRVRRTPPDSVYPECGWTLFGGVVRPKSRGGIRLTGPDPTDPVEIHANMLSHPDDLEAAIACVELCPRDRQLGATSAVREA